MVTQISIYFLIILTVFPINGLKFSSFAPDLQHDRYCHSSEYCLNVWDNHSVCVPSLQNIDIKECHCFPDFKFNDLNKTCDPFVCEEDSECQEWDPKRICRTGKCICDETYEEQLENNFLCAHIVYETPTSLLWLWLLFLVPMIAILSVILMNIYKCRTRDRNRFRY